MYLLDTNVISEQRKGARAHPGVVVFFATHGNRELYVAVQSIGEIQAGIARLRRRPGGDAAIKADAYEQRLADLLANFGSHVLDFDAEAARLWGTMLSDEGKDPHTIDKKIAAIAIVNNLTVVTRDQHMARTSSHPVRVINPFC